MLCCILDKILARPFPSLFAFEGYFIFDADNLLKKDYISGITLTGGHPLEPENYPEVLQLCKDIKAQFPNKTIWLYTGYSFLELYCHKVAKILSYIDVLVDGKYDKELRDINLKWRGSSNQRVIDVKKTLQNGEIVLLCE